MRRRRLLDEDERALWDEVAKTIRRAPRPHAAPMTLHPAEGAGKPKATGPAARGPLGAGQPMDEPLFKAFLLGERAAKQARPQPDLAPALGQAIAAAPLRMDAKLHQRMTRGKLLPEARIDLHGMTLSQAHAELIAFLLGAQAAGLRLVLVITGKGKAGHDLGPIPSRTGAIRHQLPHWLRLPPLAPIVQQLAEAHFRHGGSGAFYVYLRRG